MATNASHPTACSCGQCGVSVNRLLDVGNTWPDCIFALSPDERARRVWQDGSDRPDFIAIDGARHFVRSLLPLPLEDGAEFRYGVWLEVGKDDFDHIMRVWNDGSTYVTLRFQARLANAVEPWGKDTLNTIVEAAPRSFNERPYVFAAEQPALAAGLRVGWNRETYESIVRPYTGKARSRRLER